MGPQDLVAIILAIGVVAVLVSGTAINLLWADAEQVKIARGTIGENGVKIWGDILNVLIGALAGYMTGRKAGPR